MCIADVFLSSFWQLRHTWESRLFLSTDGPAVVSRKRICSCLFTGLTAGPADWQRKRYVPKNDGFMRSTG